MPMYDVKNNKTGKQETLFCSYVELEERCDKGEFEIIMSTPMIVSGVGSLLGKIDNGFNDVLHRIKKANVRSKIETK